MSRLIKVNSIALACLIFMMAGSLAVAHEANSPCGAHGTVCAEGFRCVSTSQGKSQCVPVPSKVVVQVPPKRRKIHPEDLLKGLSGVDEGVTAVGRVGGDPIVGPCVGVAPEPKPHVDQGKPRIGRQPLTKILRPIMLKNPTGVEKRAIVRIFRRNRGHFYRCHQRSLVQESTRSGKMKIRVTVAKTGAVSAVRVTENTLGHDALAKCMTRLVQRMRFPRTQQGPVEFEVPLLFRP